MFPCPQSDERHQRYDAGVLRPSHETDEGFLVCEAFVARPGVYEYIQPDGSVVRELIPAEELHRADSLGTLALKPVTLEHPPEDVTPDNYSRYAVGDVGAEVTVVEGGYVKVTTTIKRRDAINALKGGVREQSPGYTCRIEKTAGIDPVHGRFDQIQRDRRYNHDAITQRARGGPTIHARVDGAVITAPVRGAYQRRVDGLFDKLPGAPAASPSQENTAMSLTAEQIQQMITQGITEGLKRRDADDKQDAMQKNYDELKAKYDALMAKLKGKKGEGGEEDDKDKEDGGEKKKDSAQDFQAYYTQRRKLEELATAYRIDSKKVSELDNAALAKAIVLAARPGVRQDGDERYYLEALDFIEAPQEGRQDSDPAPNPYTHIEQGFKQAEGQRRDGNPQPTPSPSSNWLQGMNKQFQSRHA